MLHQFSLLVKDIANHEFGHILDKYNPGLRKIIFKQIESFSGT